MLILLDAFDPGHHTFRGPSAIPGVGPVLRKGSDEMEAVKFLSTFPKYKTWREVVSRVDDACMSVCVFISQ